MTRTALHGSAVVLATLLATGGPVAAATYIMFEAEGYDTYASDINASGAVTGAGVDDIFFYAYRRGDSAASSGAQASCGLGGNGRGCAENPFRDAI